MTSCACGYALTFHEGERCPLCACGAMPAAHRPVCLPPRPIRTLSPALLWGGRFERRCPDKIKNEAGNAPQLRRGTFRAPAAPLLMRRRLDGSYVPVTAAAEAVEISRSPLVPARYTQALDEIAPRAMPLGVAAAALGWQVDPWFWREADGADVSVLLLQRGELRAYAVWRGRPWRTDGAHAWRAGQFPQAVGVKRLLELIKETGESE